MTTHRRRTTGDSGQWGGLTTALIYTRVSTDDQAREGVSLDAQLTGCRRSVAQHGWILGGEYQDVMSGVRADRPQYQALLAEVRRLRSEACPVVVVVAALDRLGRKLSESVRAREELTELGVDVYSLREGGIVTELVANIFASIAQDESRRTSARIREAWRNVTSRGWHKVGLRPWGYRFRPATADERADGAPRSVLEPDPVEAPYVRELFERVAAGESVRSVRRWLAALPSAARGDRSLPLATVQGILTAAVYVGRHDHGEGPILEHPLGRWEPLLDDAMWAQVQSRLAQHKQVPTQASGTYLLSGFLRCPACGSRMRGAGRSPARYTRYRCAGSDSGAKAPDFQCGKTAHAGHIDAAVLDDVSALVNSIITYDAQFLVQLAEAWELLRRPAARDDVAGQIRRLEAEATKLRQRLTRAVELYTDGDLDKMGYEGLREKVYGELRSVEEELTRLRGTEHSLRELPSIDDVLQLTGTAGVALRDAATPEKREVLRHLIERVVPRRLKRGTYRVEITWTPLGNSLRELIAQLTDQQARRAA